MTEKEKVQEIAFRNHIRKRIAKSLRSRLGATKKQR
jgi:hypothetical protein